MLANKKDLFGAMTVKKICEKIKLSTVRSTIQRAIFLFFALTGAGLVEATDWSMGHLQFCLTF